MYFPRGRIPAFSHISKGNVHDVNFLDLIEYEVGAYYVFLTNDFNTDPKTIADLYKHRWHIELFFKWLKGHLKITAFWGQSANAVQTQICIAICSYIIVVMMKKQLHVDRNLNEILQILNVSSFVKMPLFQLISETELQNSEDQSRKQARLWDY